MTSAKKPQFAQIDGDDGQLPLAHLMDGPEDRAVAAQNDRRVGLDLREVFGAVKVGDDDSASCSICGRSRWASASTCGPLSGAEEDDPQGRSAGMLAIA